MRIERLEVGSLRTNCYLVESDGEVGVIDPGDDGEYIIRKVGERGKCIWVAATHGHFDHILAATEVSLGFNVPFYLNSKDEFLLTRAGKTAGFFTGNQEGIVLPSYSPLSEEMSLKLGSEQLVVMETPGHTPGSVSFYSRKEGMVYCGDTVFGDGSLGRTDFSYGSSKDLRRSVEMLLELPEKTMVFPGHGEEVQIEDLRGFFRRVYGGEF